MKAETQHQKTYRGNPAGGGQIVCKCGYATPIVHDGDAFTLGLKVKTVEQYFEEHIAEISSAENAMVAPNAEHAVAPSQHSQPRTPKRKEQR